MRQDMKHLKILSLILLILFIGCPDSPNNNDENEDCLKYVEGFLEPISEGNYWEREQLAYYAGQIDSSLTLTGRIVIERIISLLINNTVYLVGLQRVIYPGDIPNAVANLLWNGPNGLYYLGMIAPDDTLILEPSIRYMYPVDVGENWPVQCYDYDPYEKKIYLSDTLVYTCVAQNEPFITPIDTFNTIVYHYYYHPAEDILEFWHSFQYFSPGIGPVGTEVYSSFDTIYPYKSRNVKDLDLIIRLTDYCLH